MSKICYVTNAFAEQRKKFPDWCKTQHIEVIEVVNEQQLIETSLKEVALLISDRTPFLFKKSWLNDVTFPKVNVHPSILPFHKGAHPIFWSAILNSKWGVSIHDIAPGIDDGAIFSQVEIDYDESMTFRDLYWMYRENTHKMLKSLVTKTLSGGEIVFVPQEKCASGSHKLRDTLPHISKLANGWDTTIRDARRQLDRNLTSAFYPPSTLSEI
jgi:methionyl-tRNA formyltransferase